MGPPEGGTSWRLGTLLGVAGFTLLLGALFRNAQLTALGEALGVVVAGSWLYCRAALSGLVCERRFAPQAFEDDDVEVEVRVRNEGRLPAYLIEVQDRLEADAFPERTGLIQSLRVGSERGVRFSRPCARGRGSFALGPITLTVSDPLGLFRRSRAVPAPDRLIVFPRPLPLQGLSVESQLRDTLAGASEVARAGHTTNFFGLREYRAGEPMHRIHWRASARLDRLVVTEFEAPTHTGVTVFLDLDRHGHRGVGRGSNVEVAVRLVAAVGKRIVDQGHALQLIAEGQEATILPSGTGPRQLVGLLHTLAHVQAKGEVPYLELLRRGTPLVTEGGVVVLVFNNAHVDADAFLSLYAGWKRKRLCVLGLVVDDRELLDRGIEKREEDDGAELVMDVFERLGIPSAVVRTTRELSELAVAT